MAIDRIFAGLILVLAGAGFAVGWFGSAMIPQSEPEPVAPPQPVFTDLGIFYINFGADRHLAPMRAGVLIAPEAAATLGFAELRDSTLRLLVTLAEKPITLQEARPGPPVLQLGADQDTPGTVAPDLAVLERLASSVAPPWMLRLRLLSATNPSRLPVIAPPAEVVPLE